MTAFFTTADPDDPPRTGSLEVGHDEGKGMTSFRPAAGWGPAGHRAALSITFDNLGEAAELELGLWGDAPVGQHHTAAFVPNLAAALGDVRATYFIEASNVDIYPDAISAWAESGHEVALHAWRHEVWNDCPPERRQSLLARSFDALGRLGVTPVGFRPPGGAIPAEAWRELAEYGMLYCSEAGAPGLRCVEGVISAPFGWRAVDVYMIEDVMSFMRVRLGDPQASYSLATWRAELDGIVDAALEEGGCRTLVFHPNFLATSEEKLSVLLNVIARAKARDIWIAPLRDIAGFAASEMKLHGSPTEPLAAAAAS